MTPTDDPHAPGHPGEDWVARNSRDSGTVRDLHFYRQPGGCVEASIQNDEECDILHFCGDAEAAAFLAEFAAFIADTRLLEPGVTP